MSTISLTSDLRRKKWIREGLLQAASKSFWSPFTGLSKDYIIYQTNNENAADGHTVVFDFDGNLSQKPVKGKETAFGKGEQKKKFSDKLTVSRYRLVVDNGDKFDGKDIGDLSINEHADSRRKLGDLFVRFKDQAIFDTLSGITDNAATHVISLSTFTYGDLLDIEKTLKTGRGFDTGGVRRPIEPFMLDDGRPVWLFVVDSAMAAKLKQDPGYQTLVINADVRGNNNRAIQGVIGKLGNLLIVEAPMFFGKTYTSTTPFDIGDSDIDIAGLRQYDVTNKAWTGQEGFDYGSTLKSRGLLLGQAAGLLGMGKMPDYRFQESTDFGIKSESALEVWMATKKTRLLDENGDYAEAKVTGIDWGVVAVDVTI